LFEAVERRGIPAILVEKPVEQCRSGSPKSENDNGPLFGSQRPLRARDAGLKCRG
jgi:hypothetical protein